MKKLMKRLLIVIIVLAILIGGFLFSPLLSMSVKKSIEHFGSKTLHTEVSVGMVGINVLAGDISIKNLVVANPEGYDGHAFKLDDIEVDLDLKSIKTNVVVINSIMIDSPEVVLVNAGSNLRKLVSNLDKPVKEETKAVTAAEQEEKEGKKLIISSLTVNDANVVISKSLEVKISDIVLKNIGSEENPATVKDVISQVLKNVTKESLDALAEHGKSKLQETFKGWFK